MKKVFAGLTLAVMLLGFSPVSFANTTGLSKEKATTVAKSKDFGRAEVKQNDKQNRQAIKNRDSEQKKQNKENEKHQRQEIKKREDERRRQIRANEKNNRKQVKQRNDEQKRQAQKLKFS